MTKLFAKLQSIASQDRGATAVEYALLVGLIAVVIIGAVTALGGQLNTLFTTVKDALTGV
jgi:pilus assembly protein Flp/PilA